MNKARLKALLAQYGRIALSTYLGVFVLVLAGFAAVFSFGLEAALGVDLPEIARGAGVLGAAYAAGIAEVFLIGVPFALVDRPDDQRRDVAAYGSVPGERVQFRVARDASTSLRHRFTVPE